MQVIVTMSPDAWAPDATCDACGRRGTIARSRRTDIQSPEYRYCRLCWPKHRAQQIRLSLEVGALHSNVRRDPDVEWADLVSLVDAVEPLLTSAVKGPFRRRALSAWTSVAFEVHSQATRLTGDMPPVVRAFLDRSPRRPKE